MSGTAPLDSIVDRVEALRRFEAAAGPYLPDDLLAAARTITGRAGARLALSRDQTVVALAGATGSGKSSLFNALSGTELSTVGVRRPTTGVAHASVFGSGGAGDLLDWLGVTRRHGHDGGGDSLRGLVLLDLPDFDSVEDSHRVEVDRLLTLVDLIVWVVDPQKYADKVLHQRYLAQFRHHRDITVVVLNQADLLSPSDVERCLADLRGLLVAGGLAGVPVLATSTVGQPGTDALTGTLRRTVKEHLAALYRLAADVDVVAADLAHLVDAPRGYATRGGIDVARDGIDTARDGIDADTARQLTDALANAAGVPLVVRATVGAYRHRAVRATGWPLTKWVRRMRRDPLGRLHLKGPVVASAVPGAAGVNAPAQPLPAEATSIPPAAPAARAAVGLALRGVAERAGAGLPEPWPAAILTAARSRREDLPDALDGAVAGTDLRLSRRPLWWGAVGFLQWFAVLVALAGLLWLGLRLALFAVGLPDVVPAPMLGRLQVPTVLAFGGLFAGLLLSAVVRPVVAIGARRKGSRARIRLRAAVAVVGDELVLQPVREVVRAYADARAALRDTSRRTAGRPLR